jgi:hypothetical protein
MQLIFCSLEFLGYSRNFPLIWNENFFIVFYFSLPKSYTSSRRLFHLFKLLFILSQIRPCVYELTIFIDTAVKIITPIRNWRSIITRIKEKCSQQIPLHLFMISIFWVHTLSLNYLTSVASLCSEHWSLICWFTTGHASHFLSDFDLGLHGFTSTRLFSYARLVVLPVISLVSGFPAKILYLILRPHSLKCYMPHPPYPP